MRSSDLFTANGNIYRVFDKQDIDALDRDELACLFLSIQSSVCDGIVIFGELENGGCKQTIVSLRIYNSDGSTCGFSGNAIRATMLWLRLRGRLHSDEATFLINEYSIVAKIDDDSFVDVTLPYSTIIGSFSRSNELPTSVWENTSHMDLRLLVEKSLSSDFTLVDIGNKHAVVYSDIDDRNIDQTASDISENSVVSGGCNVAFVKRIRNGRISLVAWEKAVGRVACSSNAACAAVIASSERSLCTTNMSVDMDGGCIEVYYQNDLWWQRGQVMLC